MTRTKRLTQIAIIFSVLASSGCSYQKVQAWERGNLANPVMLRDANSSQAILEQHTYSAKESTAGGYSTGAGGCGCN
ncbi:MAG: DUF4266 domain-containing protein [Pseudomonadales bacterium]|nr:DUF4266 domain-containing protein [Pseudomonadales bacterium]